MAIDFQQIHLRIQEIGAGARAKRRSLDEKRAQARELLSAYANQLDDLRLKVDSARAVDPGLRCALPVTELLTASYPLPSIALDATLIAADGSQIDPDRHAALLYSLINIGLIVLKPGSGKTPETFSYVDLKYGDELYTDTGLITEDMVALGRDISERRRILELASNYPAPVVALTDGPVELWGAKGGNEQEYHRNRDIHLSILSQLQSKQVVVAGYIDKPTADLVIRLLELTLMAENEMKDVRKTHALRGVTDRWLFGDRSDLLLKEGERSALFTMQSSSRAFYKGDLEIQFFYLNVGDDKHPWPVRVEIPKWVANDPGMIDLLHAVLVSQCRMLGSRPYPYLLHRAHEIAVVKRDEKSQVEQLLLMELQNEQLGEGSYKQSAKELPGRTSFGRRN